METYTLDNPNYSVPVEVDYFDNEHEGKVLLLAGGDGDDKDRFTPIITKLFEHTIKHDIVTFTYRGFQSDKYYNLNQSYEDMLEVLYFLTEEKNTKQISIIATSMGAFPTSRLITDSQYIDRVNDVIFMDPADYYLDTEFNTAGSSTWTGVDEYNPHKPTAASLLNELESKATTIHVVNFLLRNRGPNGYAVPEKRHIDNPELSSRLNNDMVRTFYDNTPDDNKGIYIEDRELPHAFMRDGNLKQNVDRIVDLILTCLSHDANN